MKKIPFDTAQAIMPDSLKRFSVDLKKRISQYDMVWGEPYGPPAGWREGAPIGNGDFGAMMYGHMDNLAFVLGKTDVWDCLGQESHFPGKSFADILKAYLEKDEKAFTLLQQEKGGNQQHATTCGMFRLHVHDECVLQCSQMRVSLYDGIARSSGRPTGAESSYPDLGDTVVEVIASRQFRVLAIRLQATDTAEHLTTWLKKARRGDLGPVTWELSRQPHKPHPPAVPGVRGNTAWLTQSLAQDDGYLVAVRCCGGSSRTDSAGGRIVGTAESHDSEGLLFLLTIVSRRDAKNMLAEANRRLDRAEKCGWQKIRAAHIRWWNSFWKKGYVCVNDPGVEKWWYTSLYLAGSITEPGMQSPGLQGVWIKENVPAWQGDYHSNINLNAVYWGFLGANRLDHMEPFVRLMRTFAVQCRKDTARYFHMRGVRFPHAGGFTGHELTGGGYAPVLGVSIGGSSWLTQLIWQIYEYTGDRKYLKTTAYPLLRDVALFYEDYLRWNEKEKRWILEPSVHFESYCPTFEALGRNSLYELALVKAALVRAAAAADVLGCDAGQSARWKNVLEYLSEFPTDAKSGAWIPFDGRDSIGDKGQQFIHGMGFSPVSPGELVSIWHGSEKLKKEMRATLKGPKVKTGGPWCGGRGIREAIRLGLMKRAFDNARWAPEKKGHAFMPNAKNGLVHSWGTTYLQADNGPGMCSALNDMLLLNVDGTLRVFPSFPGKVDAAFHSLRAPGAFLVTAEKRGRNIDYVLIKSLAGNRLRLKNPWSGRVRLRDVKTGKVLAVSGADIVEIRTGRNQVIVAERSERPYRSIEKRTIANQGEQ